MFVLSDEILEKMVDLIFFYVTLSAYYLAMKAHRSLAICFKFCYKVFVDWALSQYSELIAAIASELLFIYENVAIVDKHKLFKWGCC